MYSTDIFYFSGTVISKECLQRQILSGPPVFQEATSSFYLGYSVSLKQALAVILRYKLWYPDISPWTTAPWTIAPHEIPPGQLNISP